MSQNETNNAVGRRIKAARSLKQVTVEELADLIGIPGLGAKTIGNIERGDRPLRNHEAVLLAQALGRARRVPARREPRRPASARRDRAATPRGR
jgi:transcriptional regulator with XRE-family HTH domain